MEPVLIRLKLKYRVRPFSRGGKNISSNSGSTKPITMAKALYKSAKTRKH